MSEENTYIDGELMEEKPLNGYGCGCESGCDCHSDDTSVELTETTKVKGNVKVEGRAKVCGSAIVDGNVKIRGWLDAPNIRGINKGIFVSVSDLERTYPYPYDGWMAGIGVSSPFATYVGRAGKWVPTGGTMEYNVDMSIYTEIVREIQRQMAEVVKVVPIVRLSQTDYNNLEEVIENKWYFVTNEDDVVYRIYAGSKLFAEDAGGITFPFTFPFMFASSV